MVLYKKLRQSLREKIGWQELNVILDYLRVRYPGKQPYTCKNLAHLIFVFGAACQILTDRKQITGATLDNVLKWVIENSDKDFEAMRDALFR